MFEIRITSRTNVFSTTWLAADVLHLRNALNDALEVFNLDNVDISVSCVNETKE